MRLAAIASALAIVVCVAVFGAILLQKASILVPAPPQATPAEGRAPGSVVTVADSSVRSSSSSTEQVIRTRPRRGRGRSVDERVRMRCAFGARRRFQQSETDRKSVV